MNKSEVIVGLRGAQPFLDDVIIETLSFVAACGHSCGTMILARGRLATSLSVTSGSRTLANHQQLPALAVTLAAKRGIIHAYQIIDVQLYRWSVRLLSFLTFLIFSRTQASRVTFGWELKTSGPLLLVEIRMPWRPNEERFWRRRMLPS
jgi:hypothetical protein